MLCLSGFELYSRWVPLTYECYAVHRVQALGASKLFCCHKYFRVPKLGLFYAFCGLFSLRASFDLRCSLALTTWF